MKTRLLIASVFTISVAVVLAVTLRTSANADQDINPAADDVQLSESPVPGAIVAREISEAEGAGYPAPEVESAEGERLDMSISNDAVSTSEEELSVWGEGEEDLSEEQVIEAEEGMDDLEQGAEVDTGEIAPAMTFNLDLESTEMGIAQTEGSQTITVDFPDEEIRTILRLVADTFDLNIVVPETLNGRASIKLRDVSWQQVFDVVLSPVGFTYVEDRNIIKVVSLESLTLEPPLTRVVILDYAQAADIRGTIEPLVSTAAGGRIQVDQRSNALVITERPTRLRRIEEIIADLDKPNVQVMIESKFVETRNRHLENIGVNWASLDGYSVRAGPFDHQYARERTNLQQNGRQSESVDGAPPTTLDFQNSLNTVDTARLSTAVFSADQFDVVLSALRTTNDVKLVSNPTVVTLNNRPARIHIGEEFPIVLPRFNPQTGTYEAGEFDTIDVGIKLDVTPQVNNAGFINLEVEPDVSTVASTVSYFGADYPVRATRNAKSYVTIRDGYTLAIGGLTQDDTINVQRRVPVLGSIPAIGRLFRSDSKDNDQRNLIIFLTARTLSPDGSTVEETMDPRMVHRMGLRRDEIPGYGPDIEMWPDHPKAKEPLQMEVEVIEEEVDSDVEGAVDDEVAIDGEAQPQDDDSGAVPESAVENGLAEEDSTVGGDSEVNGAVEVEAEESSPEPAARRTSRSWLTPE